MAIIGTKRVPFRRQMQLIIGRSRGRMDNCKGERYGPEAIEAMKGLHDNSTRAELFALDDKLLDMIGADAVREVTRVSELVAGEMNRVKDGFPRCKTTKKKCGIVGSCIGNSDSLLKMLHEKNEVLLTLAKRDCHRIHPYKHKDQKNVSEKGSE